MAKTLTRSAASPSGFGVDAEAAKRLLSDMLLIRRFEEKAAEGYALGKIGGFLHLYIGEEAVAVGATSVLRPDDYAISAYREHGHCLAKGSDPKRVMAELYGRRDGLSKGKGGSMHLFDRSTNFLGGHAIVGAHLPIAVGVAFAIKYRGGDQVIVCYFGDGAVPEGEFHEAMNLAALWKLPVIFLCENNRYAMGTSVERALAQTEIWKFGQTYGIPAEKVDGMDVLAVRDAVGRAVARTREQKIPALIEVDTYRYRGHSMRDPAGAVYRTKEEVEREKLRDPIVLFRDKIITAGLLSEGDIRAVVMTYREALNMALREEMRRDPGVFVIGEEVGLYEGAYKVTQGLLKEFGPQRIVDTPIAESGFTGVGIGAAMAGLRPVVEMMTFNFALLALDQIVNSAAKMYYMSGGQFNVPIVIRGPGGPAAQLAAQHSQSMETYFYHVPGLKVVRPTTPMDAKGLLKSAIRDDNPVIFIESETLYNVKGEVPEDPDFLIPLGKAIVRREGTDVTVIAYMGMMYRAMEAAEELEKEGISVELVDPRTLRPMDTETIIKSVRKTHRVVVVEAGAGFAGMGSEIAASVTEQAFDDLDAPVERVTGANAPMPYARNLEKLKTPSKDWIVAAVRRVCNANGS